MAFRFNFSNPDSDNESDHDDHSQLDSAIQAISLNAADQDASNRITAERFNIKAMKLPDTLQADRVNMPSISFNMYKRTIADVKFQIARQDTLDTEQTPMIEMAGNTDLIKGIYEGGFKTWECSIDLVEFMHSKLDNSMLSNKKILELGCGSALPGIYLLMRNENNKVDFQDYNEQVLQFITIPNIILNTVVAPTNATEAGQEEAIQTEGEARTDEEVDQEEANEDEDEEDDYEDEPEADEEELDHADAELEISEQQAPDILNKVSNKSQCFMGEWQSLPDAMKLNGASDLYDIIVTSETVYSEESIPGLVKVLQSTLRKPDGVAYVAGKTVYFGVGGGILPFCSSIDAAKDKDNHKFKYETVFETSGKNTVKREILKITWDL